MKSKTIIPLPFMYYLIPVTILAFSGLADSIYLSISHYRVYVDISYSSFCAFTRSINCDTVSQSPYSILWGMPVPIWGMIGYTIFIFCLIGAGRHADAPKHGWTLLFLLASVFSIYSGILAFISSYYVKSYCLMCIVSYAINFALLFYCGLVRKRFPTGAFYRSVQSDLVFFWNQRRRLVLGVLVPFIVVASIGWSLFPTYWKDEPSSFTGAIAHGVTPEGHPWIGAADPQIVIEQFSDYQCFQCRKMHVFLRRIISRNPQRIRLIHRQFPMDDHINPLVKKANHRGAAKMALIAIAAATKGKFWEANDYLFLVAHRKETITLQKIAESIKLTPSELTAALADPETQKMLKKDLFEGIKRGITGTPAFVINDELYQGTLPPKIIKDLVK